jgi:hypothetical protein
MVAPVSKGGLEAGFDFEDIRPYYDAEAQAVVERMSQDPLFKRLVAHLWPDMSQEEVKRKAARVNDIMDFQLEFMYDAIRTILSRSSSGLTVGGFEHLERDKPYLFVANHRDILLDSAILQVALVENGFKTSEITFGDNLLQTGFITDFGKMNRMFAVQREGSSRELYEHSRKLSAYIRYSIVSKQVSVWIAQRNGRTKDGLDQTQPGLLKMLNISGAGSFPENFKELNIVPLTISYEYEPCDSLKAEEKYLVSVHENHKKGPEEDMNSILTGILQFKGRIHLQAGMPVSGKLEAIDAEPIENEKIRKLALCIDDAVHTGYRLWPSNYIATDLLEGSARYSSHYSAQERESFIAYMHKRLEGLKAEAALLEPFFLKIYAGPCLIGQVAPVSAE